MKTHSLKCVLSLSAMSLGLVALSGCNLESGAHAEPAVRIKLAESLSPAAKEGSPSEDGKGSGTAAATNTGGPGSFSGRVVFKGTAPGVKVMYAKGKAPKESDICSSHGDILVEDLLIGADNGIANVFVYLDKAPAGFKATPAASPALFDQKNCVFVTHAMICQTGQVVKLLNDDGLPHNTHTYPNKNDSFNSTVAKNDRNGVDLVYKKPEKTPLQVKCDFHAWMLAFHLPLDHPFGAVTDKDGNFKIENLPPGDYQFKVWHEKADGGKGGFLESKYKVSVKGGDVPPVTISADAAKFGL